MTDQPEIDPAILEAMNGLQEEFAGFAGVYQNEIRPALQAREHDREKAVSKARKYRYIGIGLGLAIRLDNGSERGSVLGLAWHGPKPASGAARGSGSRSYLGLVVNLVDLVALLVVQMQLIL